MVTVRKKISLAIISIVLLMIVSILAIAGVIQLQRAKDDDSRQTVQMTRRASLTLERELAELDRVTADYAGWDDTYAFVENGNMEYIQSNLVDETFSTNRFGFFIILNLQRNVVYSKGFDLSGQKESSLPSGLLQLIGSDSRLIRKNDPKDHVSGVWYLTEGPVILASQPIITSLYQGPVRGTLIIGRALDSFEISRLMDLTQLSLTLYSETDPRIRPAIVDCLKNSSSPDTICNSIVDDQTIAGFRLMRSEYGGSGIVLRVENTREFRNRAIRVMWLFVAALVGVGGVACILSLILLDRIVLRRLANLHGFVKNVESSSERFERFTVDGQDELSQLGISFNDLLERIEHHLAGHRQAEDALKTSEERLQAIFQTAPDGIFIKDSNYCYTTINPSMERIFGIPAAQLVGKNDFELFSDVTARGMTEGDKQLCGEVISEEYPILLHGENATIHMIKAPMRDGSGAVTKLCGITRDISDKKRAELKLQGTLEALRESERRFKEIFETVQLIAVMLDLEGRITFCNDYLLQLSGWTRQELIGQIWFEIFVPLDYRSAVKSYFLHTLNSSKVISHYENPILTAKGELRQIAWDNTMLRDHQGMIIGTASLGRDITDFLTLEEQYRQSQKMEAIGQLVGGIAHDFNNLLQVISGFCELAMQKLPEQQPPYSELTKVIEASSRAINLVQQMLAFSRRQPMQCKFLDIDTIIVNISKLIGRVIGEHIEFLTSSQGEIPLIYADPGHIEQVIMNLCVNARDAMPNGGTLRIETDIISADNDFLRFHHGVEANQYLRVTVTDTGIGMPPEVKEHIFEPFFTTKDKGKGTGLGLSTVYGIVKQHKGFIDVQSTVGRGTRFIIYLPAAKNPTATPMQLPEGEDSSHGMGETILLVEDDEMVRDLALRVLLGEGYKVLTAGNGEEALELFQSKLSEIDLFVFDVVMPKMNGPALFDIIRKIIPTARVLFCSGYSFGTLENPGFPTESYKLLQKPYSPKELLLKVRKLLDKQKE